MLPRRLCPVPGLHQSHTGFWGPSPVLLLADWGDGGGRRADPGPQAAVAVPGQRVVPRAVSERCWLGAVAVQGLWSLNSAVAQLQRKMEERRLRLQEAANR